MAVSHGVRLQRGMPSRWPGRPSVHVHQDYSIIPVLCTVRKAPTWLQTLVVGLSAQPTESGHTAGFCMFARCKCSQASSRGWHQHASRQSQAGRPKPAAANESTVMACQQSKQPPWPGGLSVRETHGPRPRPTVPAELGPDEHAPWQTLIHLLQACQ
jgi:hypothetical protein